MGHFNTLHNPQPRPDIPGGTAEVYPRPPRHVLTVSTGGKAAGFQFKGRGNPVPQLKILPQLCGAVGMQIDKAGRYHQALCINHFLTR